MAKTYSTYGSVGPNNDFTSYSDYFVNQSFDDDLTEDSIKKKLGEADPRYVSNFDNYVKEARTGKTAGGKYSYALGWDAYDPNDLSDGGLKKLEDTYQNVIKQSYGNTGFLTGAEFAYLSVVGMDLHRARTQYNNQKMQGVLGEIETGKLQRKQFEQMRKIASEGNEEASEDQRPTGKASVLIGSNTPDRKQKRTSYSRDAGTAKAKVKVQAKGINI